MDKFEKYKKLTNINSYLTFIVNSMEKDEDVFYIHGKIQETDESCHICLINDKEK